MILSRRRQSKGLHHSKDCNPVTGGLLQVEDAGSLGPDWSSLLSSRPTHRSSIYCWFCVVDRTGETFRTTDAYIRNRDGRCVAAAPDLEGALC